jgi:hypothetical protein
MIKHLKKKQWSYSVLKKNSVFFFYFHFIFFISTSSLDFKKKSFRLFLNWSSHLNHIGITLTWFNFKPKLNKRIGSRCLFPTNLISFFLFNTQSFFSVIRLSLNMSSRLDYVRVTFTWFNFKLKLDNKLGREVFYVYFILFFSLSSSVFLQVDRDVFSLIKLTESYLVYNLTPRLN